MGQHAGRRDSSGPLWVFAAAIAVLVFLLGLWVGAANSHAVLRHPAPTPTVTRTVTKSPPAPPTSAVVPADRCMTAAQLQALAKIRLDAEDLVSRTSTSSGAYYDELRALPARIDQLAASGRC